jgi:hypothetical protein
LHEGVRLDSSNGKGSNREVFLAQVVRVHICMQARGVFNTHLRCR